MRKILTSITATILCAMLALSLLGCSVNNNKANKVKVLIVPKFEVDNITGDFPGEAQLFYEKYCAGKDKIELPNLPGTASFYYNQDNGAAILITGSGKTAATLAMTAVLNNPDYDLSEAFIVSVGCSGGSYETTVLGDVVLVTGACDNELGHTADIREFEDTGKEVTWFQDPSFDGTAYKVSDAKLNDRVFGLIKEVELQTTELSRSVTAENFPGEEWRLRDPMVIKGTSVTGDSYWKGIYGHNNAVAVTGTYKMPDPYASTEMEDLAMANVAESYGFTNRFITLRVVVDLDVFLGNDSPESLWSDGEAYNDTVDDTSGEMIDVFEPGMHNLFDASEIVIDAILDGTLSV